MFKPYLIILLCFLFPTICICQSVSFTYQNAGGTAVCSPATISFTQNITGSPLGYTWYFGNGQESNDANPSMTYASGSYIVRLVAVFETSAIEAIQTITVNPSFTVSVVSDKNYICLPGSINFTAAATTSVIGYEWNFGDGTIINNNTPTLSHAYTTLGSFTTTVKAIDANGCSASASVVTNIKKPPIDGNISPIKGCAPMSVNLLATVTVPTGSNVTNYLWNFGDGSPSISGGTGSFTHIYLDSGSFIPTVDIITSEGCTNSFSFPKISFGIPPINAVAYPKKNIYCGNETTTLVGKAKYANEYKWDYGDGTIETITDTVTTHRFATLGNKTITVTPYFNGCVGVTKIITLDIVGVIAGFTYTNTCSNKKTFSFTNTSQGNQSTIQWSFGDGSADVFATNVPAHTYPAVGAYITSLVVSDNITGCKDSLSITIFTANPSFTNIDTFLCRNSSTTFTIPNNYTNTGVTYKWEVIGLSVTNSTNPYTVAASVFGDFVNNYVVINNGLQYCADTLNLDHKISVRGPNLSYTIPSSFCAKNNLLINNTSIPYLDTDTVKLWYWNYGIGSNYDSIYQPQNYSYPVGGTYSIKLFAKDKNGCVDSLFKTIAIKTSPFLRVFPRMDTLCQGKKDTLIAFHSDTLSWSPTALVSCTTCDTIVGNPSSTTIFYATAVNSTGCKIVDSSIVKVFAPFKATPIKDPIMVCKNDTARINVTPLGKIILWSPSIGLSNNTVYNPLVTVTNNTIYKVSLADSVGCFTSDTVINIIVKLLPIVDAGADKTYSYNTPFTITPNYSNNVISYLWKPSATLSCADCPNPNGIAVETQTFIIKATSNEDCVASDTINIFIECKNANLFMPSAFTPKSVTNNNRYYPLTRGIKTVSKFMIFNRYGQLLFDAKNIKPNDKLLGWDGKFNGEYQPSGAYVYMLEALCEKGETITKKDSFLLIR